MRKVKDPVCGMEIDAGAAAGTSSANGATYYFCSTQCQKKFEADPGRYAASSATGFGHADKIETLERNLTQKGGVAAPRFGSAGSGGLEFEGPAGRTGE